MDESIFVDEELQDFNSDKNKPLLPSTSSPELVTASTLKAETTQATTSSTTAVEASRVTGDIISEQGASFHIQKGHPPQLIIGNLNERVTQFSRSAHLSYLPTLCLLLYSSLIMLDTHFLIQVVSMTFMKS
jgi:hypothetical protein